MAKITVAADCAANAAAPMPVKDYLAAIRVDATGPASCHVDWSASFEPPPGLPEAKVAAGLEGAYGGALKSPRPLVEA